MNTARLLNEHAQALGSLERQVTRLMKEVDFMKEQIAHLDRYKADNITYRSQW